MTIGFRRRTYWTFFVLSLLALGSAGYASLPLWAGELDLGFLSEAGAYRSFAFFGWSLDSPYAATAAALLLGLLSVAGLALVLSFFRKTASPEVFLFSLWILALGAESGRVLVLRLAAADLPPEIPVLATRILLGFRYTGQFALAAAGLHAAGFGSDKPGIALGIVAALGAGLASIMPLNTGSYLPTLIVRPGFYASNAAMPWIIGLVTAANFLYGSRLKTEGAYRIGGLGVLALTLGQALLLFAWRPPAMLSGALLTALGAWLLISRMHRYYLWQ